ncbi:MAG: trypsin-like serine protease [Microcystis aeruginosa G13-01]|nr:trypsin-like serine protease [Microcystis aeruginosa SX13-01]NCR88157.1 trypsin-like serine protease [Microcystis aeruginosa G13-10]NCS33626.1 trypsin-like serine protease [Microcystis aeruginosa G11-01]NCT63151.1 trypsin-like serine protease [Microcystis aeruginosa G13-01]
MIKRWFAWLGIVSILIPFPVAIAQFDGSRLKAITVRIDMEKLPDDSPNIPLGGSGVIIRGNGNSYIILTAYHVVMMSDRDYVIKVFNRQTPDQLDSYRINRRDCSKKIKKIEDIDLATIEITSNKSYETATLDTKELPKKDDIIYVAGYPLNNGKSYLDLDGKIFDIAPHKDKYGTLPRAYYFNNLNTSTGMSGGPLVNQQGNIVGILIGEKSDSGTGAKTASVVMPIQFYPQWQAIRNSQRLSSPLPSPNQTLEQLLAAKKWGAANDKTWEILLKEGDADQSGDLNSFEVKNLECSTLKYLDVKWQQASGGEYGFKVQRGIYSAYHSEYNRDNPESNIDKYTAFAQKVGWFNNIQEISKDLSPNSLYSRKKTNRGFYPIWFVYGEKIEKIPFGLPVPIYNNYNELDDLYKYRDPWQSEGTILYGRLWDCL